MANGEKEETPINGRKEEERTLLDEISVLDFDMLCSTVALQTEGKRRRMDENGEYDGAAESSGVLRMWEGDVFDCLEERRIAIEVISCPCYRFGRNMKRAGFGSYIMQSIVHFVLAVSMLISLVALVVTRRIWLVYSTVFSLLMLASYMGFFRTRIRRKFNIRVNDSPLDDMGYHLICPCCTLCQESRTLERNNVQNGVWHGRGEMICVGGGGNWSEVMLHPPSMVDTKISISADERILKNTSDCNTAVSFPSTL